MYTRVSICVLLVACLAGCGSGEGASPATAMSGGGMYYEKDMHNRFFLIGQKDTLQKLEDNGHIPYAKTLIGEGPEGKTLVVEIDKKNPDMTERLLAEYRKRHPYYQEVEMHGRLFVLGNPDTHGKLLDNGHIPYARTRIGEGPDGQTVVFEIDKKDPAMTERLEETFYGNYYVEKEAHGRTFVLGQPATRDKLMDNGHIPYARTMIGAGANGETVVFEIDKKKPELTERLEKQYFSTWYAEQDAHGRTFVLGQPDTRDKLMDNGHIPYARTFIGAGKGGKTVVVEIDKKNPDMTDRLIAEYESRHGVTLE